MHESRTAEDRRTAAELAARLTKLRTEHKDSAAHAASQLDQPADSTDTQTGPPERFVKEKKPWPAKVHAASVTLIAVAGMSPLSLKQLLLLLCWLPLFAVFLCCFAAIMTAMVASRWVAHHPCSGLMSC